MAKLKKYQRREITRFAEYMVSGGAYFWTGYFILNYLYYGLHWSLFWATMISNVIGWTVNYLLQRFWVFNSKLLKDHKTQVTSRYITITLVDFGLNYLILYALERVGITPAIGQFISSGFFTIWNYLWYKFWVFPEKFDKQHSIVTPARVIAHRSHGHSGYKRVSG